MDCCVPFEGNFVCLPVDMAALFRFLSRSAKLAKDANGCGCRLLAAAPFSSSASKDSQSKDRHGQSDQPARFLSSNESRKPAMNCAGPNQPLPQVDFPNYEDESIREADFSTPFDNSGKPSPVFKGLDSSFPCVSRKYVFLLY